MIEVSPHALTKGHDTRLKHNLILSPSECIANYDHSHILGKDI